MLACQQYSPMTKVSIDKLAGWISLVEECYYHNLDYSVMHEHVEDTLEFFGVPNEWKAVVRVMAQGASYYSEDTWYAKHVDESQRKAWMNPYWDQN